MWAQYKLKMLDPLLKNYYEFQDSGNRATHQAWDPSQCNHMGCLPMKPALCEADALM